MCSLERDLIVFNYAYHHPRVLCDKNATWMFNIKKSVSQTFWFNLRFYFKLIQALQMESIIFTITFARAKGSPIIRLSNQFSILKTNLL